MPEGGAKPWLAGDSDAPDARRHAPATLRNRDSIAAVLEQELPAEGVVLEIASGSGEHAVHFARCFPDLRWQPTDPDAAALASIAAHAGDAELSNLLAPIQLDAAAQCWPVAEADAIVCINMLHISPWQATEGLMAGAARLLSGGAPLLLYGPFLEAEVATAAGNLEFDAALRLRDERWGLRDRAQVDAAAQQQGLWPARRVDMPANNLMLVYRKA